MVKKGRQELPRSKPAPKVHPARAPSESGSSTLTEPSPPPRSTVQLPSVSNKRGVMEICDKWLSGYESPKDTFGEAMANFGYSSQASHPSSSPFQSLPSSSTTLIGTEASNGKRRKIGNQGSVVRPVPNVRLIEEDDDSEMSLDLRSALHDRGPEPLSQPARFAKTPRPSGAEDGMSVLVKIQRNYFPGFIVEYLPALSPEDQKRGLDRYRVRTQLDGEIIKRRNEIILLNEAGIANCPLGEIHTSVASLNNDAATRPPTPPPRTARRAKPLSSAAFGKLSRAAQIRQLHPLLQDMIKEEHPSAQWRIDAFYGSAAERAALKQEAQYGDIKEAELVAVIIPELERWALRAERWDGVDRNHQPDEPARPTGSKRYEELSVAERRNFVTDVLLPETIVHICISSFDHPDTDSPQETYEAARKRLGELALEDDVSGWNMRLIEIHEARLRKRKAQGLPREDLTSYEKSKMRVVKGELVSWTGRIRKKFGADIVGDAPIEAPLRGI